MGLTTQHDDFASYIAKVNKVRAMIEGKDALLEMQSCLCQPQYSKANNDARQRKLDYFSRGQLFPATARTEVSLTGMLWSKEPVADLAPQLEYLTDNADGEGCGLREVVQDISDDVTSIGRYFVLVDMPQQTVNENGERVAATRAQQESGEFAPRLIQYKSEQIFYWRTGGNKCSLQEVRFTEVVSVKSDSNDFDWEDKTFVRRLVLIDGVYYNELYSDKEELIEVSTPVANGRSLNYIPGVFFGSDANTAELSKIPLLDLTNLNEGHFILDCDNRENLHFHAQGITNVYTNDGAAFNEMNPNGLDVGAKGRNVLGSEDRVEILQMDASGALPDEMARDEKRMIAAGAQLVQDANTNVTLGAKEMEFGASTTSLKRISHNLTDGVNALLRYVSDFLAVSQASTYTINSDFVTDDMSPQMIAEHLKAVQAGVMPRESYYQTARDVGFTSEDDETLNQQLEDESLDFAGGMSEQEAAAQAQSDEE